MAPGNASRTVSGRVGLPSMTREPDLSVGSSRWLGAAAVQPEGRRAGMPPPGMNAVARHNVQTHSIAAAGVAQLKRFASRSPSGVVDILGRCTGSHGIGFSQPVRFRRIVSTVTTRRCQDCAPRQRLQRLVTKTIPTSSGVKVHRCTDQLSSPRACVAAMVARDHAGLHLQIPSAATRVRRGDPWRCAR